MGHKLDKPYKPLLFPHHGLSTSGNSRTWAKFYKRTTVVWFEQSLNDKENIKILSCDKIVKYEWFIR